MRRQEVPVIIVGAGPAGLLIARLLDLSGVDCVVLEKRDRDYVEGRQRAGLLEQHTVDVLRAAGVADRLDVTAVRHPGLEIRCGGRRHHLPVDDLVDESTWIYGQQEVVKDLIAARLATGRRIHFGVSDIRLLNGFERPVIRARIEGVEVEIAGDYLICADGSRGSSATWIRDAAASVLVHEYPFAWLGILAEAPPCSRELVYAAHERGFALLSMRSSALTRAYLQVDPEEVTGNWPDARVWGELHRRLDVAGAEPVREGPILDKSITRMRSVIVDPVRFGAVFLVGDAAHIVPPSAAKGLNLAVADAESLAEALVAHYRHGRSELLDSYSAECLRRAWSAQIFSVAMTELMHRFPGRTPFEFEMQQARLRQLFESPTSARAFAADYTGRSRRRLPV